MSWLWCLVLIVLTIYSYVDISTVALFHCLGIVLFGTQKYDVEAYTGTILKYVKEQYDGLYVF